MAQYARQIIIGVDPLTKQVQEFTYLNVLDQNQDSSFTTCGFAPNAKSGIITMSQDGMFIGTMGADKTVHALRKDQVQDEAVDFTAEIITNRIDPTFKLGAQPDNKVFYYLDFLRVNPYDQSAVVYYTADVDDPTDSTVQWTEMFYNEEDKRVYFPEDECIARWVHLRVLNTLGDGDKEFFGPFNLGFERLGSRGEDEGGSV